MCVRVRVRFKKYTFNNIMCGIFACIHKSTSKVSVDKLQEGFDKIQHRGPDSSTWKTITTAAGHRTAHLGFHRLAIIGESDEILQDGRGVYAVCNGEIYNYKHLIKKYNLQMNSESDCEVIVQLYQKFGGLTRKLIDEFDGVFAFVLWDSTKEIFIAARDRIGVRPLFWAIDNNNVYYFASEAKAIQHVTTVEQFRPGYVFESPNTLYSFVGGGTTNNCVHATFDTCKIVLRELLTRAVEKRFMSDRPIGFLVSGGVDSSLIAAIANRISPHKITTFSIGLENSSDLIASRVVADFLQSNHHEVIITPAQIVDAIPNVVRQLETYDITTIRASIPMYLLSKFIRKNTPIKVIFSGEGADELFGGYLYSHKAPSLEAFSKDCERLMNELHVYDVLRGDRATAAWGLEIRVPFLDIDFMNFVRNMDPYWKMPSTFGVEKHILRDAFKDHLPKSILERQKQAFSDGVGYNSVETIKTHAATVMAASPAINIKNGANPVTAEGKLYFDLFSKHYKSCPLLYPSKYWMPQWCDNVTDPSATVLLDIHKKNAGEN